MPTQIEEMWASFQRKLDMDLDLAEKRTETPDRQPQYSVPKPQPPPQPNPTPASYPKVMPLNVGGRRFEVARSTLLESGLFRHQLSDKFAWGPEPDGWYFLDADPEIFEHLLCFMRQPSVFPLFWSQSEGFDFALYHRVQTDAEYFQLDALHEWIKMKKYLTAVTVHVRPPCIKNIEEVVVEKIPGNRIEDWQIIPQVRKIYLCPRDIYCHKGRPDACGAACRQAQDGHPIKYEESHHLQMVIVTRVVIFDENVCQVPRGD